MAFLAWHAFHQVLKISFLRGGTSASQLAFTRMINTLRSQYLERINFG